MNFAQLVGSDEKQSNEENPQPESLSRKIPSEPSISSNSSNNLNAKTYARSSDEDDGVQMEASSRGKVQGSVSMSYFRAGANWPTLVVLATLFLIVQILASGADYWVSFWLDLYSSCSVLLLEVLNVH